MSLPKGHAANAGFRRRRTSSSFWAESLAIALLQRFLRQCELGELTIALPSGREIKHIGTPMKLHARLVIHRWRFLKRVLVGGDLGFAEAFMDGDWSTPDLTALLEYMQRNEAALRNAWQGSLVSRTLGRLRHAKHANTRRGSQRNIEAHYDLGNAFYASWLDNGMNYSSALYTSPSLTLEQAQIVKLDRVISLLNISADDRVLEIGCGWGALAERMATKQGAHVTAITLSQQQHAYATARLRKAGVEGRSVVKLQDYRDTHGTFDAIVSIEMLEAAGEAYWPVYFAKLKSCLAPGGTAVLQVITIEEPRFSEYQGRPDFIQHYIFPGGMLPTVALIKRHAEAFGLTVQSQKFFGMSYARTLSEWRTRYVRANHSANAPHLDTERFRRMWHYYLAYCEVGFKTGALDVGLYQITHR